MNCKTRSLITLTAAAFVATAAVAATTDVRLRERAVVTSPVVRLGDVAEVVSADRSHARQLAALPLMPAPPAGAERFLRQREVQDLLAAHGQNLAEIRFNGAVQVSVTAPGTTSENGRTNNRQAALLAGHVDRANTRQAGSGANDLGNEFRSIIESYLNTKSERPGIWRVSCEVAERHVALLDTATAPPVCRGGSEPWTGRQRFVVSFDTAQGTVDVPVYAEVENLTHSVVVAVQPLARGDVITAAGVAVQNLPLPPGTNGRRVPIGAVENIVGMEARQSIQAGQVIFTDQVQPPLMVKRGDLVTVASGGGGIRVRTTARARQDGTMGELVQVESLESRERFEARVVGSRQLAVFAAVRPIPLEHVGRTDSWATIPGPPRPPQAQPPAHARPPQTVRRPGETSK